MDAQTPEYRLLEPAFFEPNLLPAGATVKFRGPPGPHLQPLNRAAYDKLEAWYDEEVDEVDAKTGKKTGEKVRPHAKYRIGSHIPGEVHEAEILTVPMHDDSKRLMTLAEAMNARAKATDVRPGPAAPQRPGYDPSMDVEAQEASAPAPEPVVEVTASAPASPYAGRKVG